MFPTQTAAMQFTTVTAVREHYQLPDPVWRSFIEVCGDPNDDLMMMMMMLLRMYATEHGLSSTPKNKPVENGDDQEEVPSHAKSRPP